jgi:predicted CopG family antitoxin
MSTADEQIRVSATVKNELEHWRRGNESFNDVLERLLSDDRDLFAGFGAFEGTDRGAAIQRTHEQGTGKSNERVVEIEEY